MFAIALTSCTACNRNPPRPNEDIGPTPLTPLQDFAGAWNAAAATYSPEQINTAVGLLETRQANVNNPSHDDYQAPKSRSVVVKIFMAADPSTVVETMRIAALPAPKMLELVGYMTRSSSVQGQDNLFDDVDFLNDLSDEYDRMPAGVERNRKSDHVQRQRRKIMSNIFAINMTPDEFARTLSRLIIYGERVTHQMHEAHGSLTYDEYVKRDLDFDTLVYFKGFNAFTNDTAYTISPNLSAPVQLYAWHYEFNRVGYNVMKAIDNPTAQSGAAQDDGFPLQEHNYRWEANDAFERELKYERISDFPPNFRNTFTGAQWRDYVRIKRTNYALAYRYEIGFLERYYAAQFAFQRHIEEFDESVYAIGFAFADNSARYVAQMQEGFREGFADNLKFSDIMYTYFGDDVRAQRYNDRNSAFENAEAVNAPRQERQQADLRFRLERVAVLDFALERMNNRELGGALVYQIRNYSADNIRNIQLYKKYDKLYQAWCLDGSGCCRKRELEKHSDGRAYDEKETLGRNAAYIAQIMRYFSPAFNGLSNSLAQARSEQWDDIRLEVKAVLNENYDAIPDTADRLAKFDDLLIKQKMSCGHPKVSPLCDHTGCTEQYDTEHSISRLLHHNEAVLRYAWGQVEVTLRAPDTNASGVLTAEMYDLVEHIPLSIGGVDTVGPYRMTGSNYSSTHQQVIVIDSGTSVNGNVDLVLVSFGPYQRTHGISHARFGGVTANYTVVYTFVGWFIDTNMEYQVDPGFAITFDMMLYPGFSAQITRLQN
jgi:hypothetical protein